MMDNRSHIVSNCLEILGYKLLARDAYSTQNPQILESYIKIAEMKARKYHRFDVLDMLVFGGLIYA